METVAPAAELHLDPSPLVGMEEAEQTPHAESTVARASHMDSPFVPGDIKAVQLGGLAAPKELPYRVQDAGGASFRSCSPPA